MKDGDISVVLKNVRVNDAGTYECFIRNTGGDLELISNIHLRVQVPVNIRAEPGQFVSLPCRASTNTDITAAEWTRPGLEQEYVLMYLDGKPVPYFQHQAFKDRVDLKDGEMKDGDVSMILKNVNRDDTGTYECRVAQGKTKRRKRSAENELISIVYLEVQSGETEEGGDKERGDMGLHVGLGVGLTALVVVGGFIVSRKHRKPPEQSSHRADDTAAKKE